MDLLGNWNKFLKTQYPSSAHSNNSEYELLDSTIAGCISSFVANKKLDQEKINILEDALEELQVHLINNIPVDAQNYFRQLLSIGKYVLDSCKSKT